MDRSPDQEFLPNCLKGFVFSVVNSEFERAIGSGLRNMQQECRVEAMEA